MGRALLTVGLALAALVLVALVRAADFQSKQLVVTPTADSAVDAAAVADRLAAAIRFRTVSHTDRSQIDEAEFERFHRHLQRTYPALHAALELEPIAGQSLLYTWRGRRSERRPVLLLAHQDVVPVEKGTEKDWQQPPFAGRVARGFVWGRGAMDNKGSLVCILEAVEALVAEGFQPERTVMLAFGHDEELGGDLGAAVIAQKLHSRGVRPVYVLDEGGVIAVNMIPGMDAPVALIGIAEKGSATVDLRVDAEGGHSSTPPRNTAIGLLSRAVAEVESHPMPSGIGRATELMIDYLAPELGFPARVVLANLWLFRGVIARALASEPTVNAMLRTTTAATLIQGGVKENVLPSHAWAAVNFRILPGDTIDDVVQHVRRSVTDERVRVELSSRSTARNPSPVSPVDGEGFEILQRTIGEVFPGVLVAPFLVLGGTDARHYQMISDNLYRFGPFAFTSDARRRVHGTNERMGVEALGDAVRFYIQLIRNTAG